ncbi:MAG: vWA domain-containing protein [Polyangiaceae bacterium]
MKIPRVPLALLVALAALLGALASCSGSGADRDGASSTAADGDGDGDSSGGASSLAAGSSGVGGGGDACLAESIGAELRPVDLYVMLDQSGSMMAEYDHGSYDSCGEAVSAGDLLENDRWTNVTAALSGFVSAPGSAGIGLGLGFFPPKGPQAPGQTKCEDDKCDVSKYATPTVEVAELPGAAADIDAALAFSPCLCNSTPMSAALQGAVAYAGDRAAAHPDRVPVVVLATDGEPKGDCSGGEDDSKDYAAPAAVAAAAYAAPAGIRTYVIGVGQSLTSLDAIAEAGGTDAAYLVDASQGTEQAFLEALEKIRIQAIACEISIPAAEGGASLDYGKVNVEYVPGDGSQGGTLTQVPDAAACEASPESWYYDVPQSPTKIVVCDGACGKLKVDVQGEITIGLGCDTVTAVPK